MILFSRCCLGCTAAAAPTCFRVGASPTARSAYPASIRPPAAHRGGDGLQLVEADQGGFCGAGWVSTTGGTGQGGKQGD